MPRSVGKAGVAGGFVPPGVDQTNVPWNQGFPVCQACAAVAEGRMS